MHLIKVHFVKDNDQSMICLLYKKINQVNLPPRTRGSVNACKHGIGLSWSSGRTPSSTGMCHWTLLCPPGACLTLNLMELLRTGASLQTTGKQFFEGANQLPLRLLGTQPELTEVRRAPALPSRDD